MNPSNKQFKIPADRIQRLIPNMGACFATDRIMVDGLKVGYMFREQPDKEGSSGWTFMSGDESQEYADNPDNWAIYEVNTVCNYDPAIIGHLNSAYNSAFGRIAGTDKFQAERFEPEQ